MYKMLTFKKFNLSALLGQMVTISLGVFMMSAAQADEYWPANSATTEYHNQLLEQRLQVSETALVEDIQQQLTMQLTQAENAVAKSHCLQYKRQHAQNAEICYLN